MKKLALLTVFTVAAGLLNVGCAASGSIKPTGSTDAGRASANVAYATAPAPAK